MICCIDIGGTHMRVALSTDHSTLSTPVIFDTPQDPQQAITALIEAIKPHNAEDIESVVIAFPGTIKDASIILSAPNLSSWEGINLSDVLMSEGFKNITVINDAFAAALGEAHRGAGVQYTRVGYITVSTGLGGALIVKGEPHETERGFEPGRQIIDYKNNITLQDLTSGAGVRKETGKKPREVLNQSFWDEKAKILATGLWNTIVHWMPDVLIINGPMVLGNPRIDLEQTKKHLVAIAHQDVVLPVIVESVLKDEAGLWGVLESAK